MQISRVRKASAIGLVFASAAGLALGEATASASKERAPRASTAGNVPTHTYVDLQPAVSSTMDPEAAGGTQQAGFKTLAQMTSPLLRPKGADPAKGKLPGVSDVAPYLAKSWRRQANGDYIFQLRTSAVSQYGNHLSAADVQYSLQRAMALSFFTKVLFTDAGIDVTNPVTVISPSSVRVNVTRPTTLVLAVLALHSAAIIDSTVMKSHATSTDPWAAQWAATNTDTFGPYEVSQFQPQQAIEYTYNPHFFGPKPYFTQVIVRAVSDASVREEEMLGGDASHTVELEWPQYQDIHNHGRSKGVAASLFPASSFEQIILQEKTGGVATPFANILVRRAVSLAIDRGTLNRTVYRGLGTPLLSAAPTTFPLSFKPPTMKSNLATARKLLSQAGYPNGFSIDLWASSETSGNSAADEMAEVQDQLARIGILVQPHLVASANEFATGTSKKQYSMYLYVSTAPTSSLSLLFSLLYSTTGLINTSSFSNTTLDTLITKLLSESSGGQYKADLKQAYGLVFNNVPDVNLMGVPLQNVTDASIKGYLAYPYPITWYEYLHR